LIDAQTITIASYNVENLFDMHRDGTEYVEYVPGRHGWSEAMLRKKIQNITEVICDLEADVIGLQEVENDNALSQLQKSLKRAGCEYRFRAITTSKRTPIHNAILSKIPIRKKRDVTVSRYGRHRSMLEVTLKSDPPLRIFVNHWKSKRGPESERIPYARAMMRRISKMPKGTEYVLIGDFNSNYNESATMDKKHNDTGGVTGINNILKTTRDNGKMVRLNDMGDGEHTNLWMDVAAGSRWSHNFFGDKEGIDAMIIPPSLHDGTGWDYVAGTYEAFKPKYLFGYHGRVNRWAYKHSKHLGKGYSDHLPVYGVFTNDSSSESKTYDTKKSWWESFLGLFQSTQNQPEPEQVKMQQVISKPTAKTTATDIAHLKKMSRIKDPVSLKEVCVVFRRGDSAVIQQEPDGEAILLYRSAMQMEEGGRYDIIVHKKKRYKGLEELVDVEIEHDAGRCDSSKFVFDFSSEMMSDEKYIGKIVKDISGVVESRKIKIGSNTYPIHFRKKAGRPKQGTSITIDRGQISYYKDHMELVVWSKEDYN
jgi:hypothetical protein